MISKGERTELRSVVRGQFKVLRSEIEQRRLEMYAEVEQQIVDRFAAADQQWVGIEHAIHEATMEANRQINNVLYEAGLEVKGGTERMWIQTPRINKPEADRHELRKMAGSRIEAQVKAAGLRLEREEADLLRTLAVGSLESDEARAFLSNIPSVADLVSGARLSELEAQFKNPTG